jgi:hypothetical protein
VAPNRAHIRMYCPSGFVPRRSRSLLARFRSQAVFVLKHWWGVPPWVKISMFDQSGGCQACQAKHRRRRENDRLGVSAAAPTSRNPALPTIAMSTVTLQIWGQFGGDCNTSSTWKSVLGYVCLHRMRRSTIRRCLSLISSPVLANEQWIILRDVERQPPLCRRGFVYS